MNEPLDDLPVVTLTRGDGAERRDLAVRVREGRGPTVVWLGGFMSDMRATKALSLDAWAMRAGRRLVRFDYTGHGESGGTFAEATISTWLGDALALLEHFACDGPVLVGSSMGGWIACLAAAARRKAGRTPPSGMVLIAPALDFTEALMWPAFTPEIRAEIETKGVWYRHTQYSPIPTPITRHLIEDGRSHSLLGGPIDTGCPVHILQGMQDPDVPYAHALRTLERLPAEGTLLTLIKDGDHRLSRPQDVALLLRAVEAIA